jgi:predicted MPP superfamily phosphohydrolase
MSDKFVILHLSDAHLGNPKCSLDSLNVFDPLLKDLREYSARQSLKPNLIVFSGDLAFGDIPQKSLKDQYADAKDYLLKIFSCFDAKYGELPLLIVPGNHDINQNLIGEGEKLLRPTLTQDKVSAMMMNKKDVSWKHILERQQEWFAFVKCIPDQDWNWNEELYMATGIIHHKDKQIGIAGLNSSWASHGQKEKGELWIGKNQYETAYQAIRAADLKIVVSHHPVEWLHEEDVAALGHKLEIQFQIFLHGHEHSSWFSASDGHLRCAAGACYNGSERKNGYSWLVIDTESSEIAIHLREYTNEGAGSWRANSIDGKTDTNGIATISLAKKSAATTTNVPLSPQPPETAFATSISYFPDNLEDYIKILQDRFYFRWESATRQSTSKPLIFWPVRLRQPTPIHASQCFVAAGLQKLGCRISLWTDDLGNAEYSYDVFSQKLKDWYSRAGGDESQIDRRRFKEILDNNQQHLEPAWGMLQKWLGSMQYYTDRILKISKIWPSAEDPSKDDPENIVKEIAKRRPRRLLTPSMVWTCLQVLYNEEPTIPIITLGGYDEQELWDAWRACCGFPDMQVGHLYISKLTHKRNDIELAIHMQVNQLAWTSREDIVEEFRTSLAEIDSPETWSNVRSMIPWIINNCVLLPNFVTGSSQMLTVKARSISNLDDLKLYAPSDIFDELVEAVNSWLL